MANRAERALERFDIASCNAEESGTADYRISLLFFTNKDFDEDRA